MDVFHKPLMSVSLSRIGPKLSMLSFTWACLASISALVGGEDTVEPPKHGQRQNDLAVLGLLVITSQQIGDRPDKRSMVVRRLSIRHAASGSLSPCTAALSRQCLVSDTTEPSVSGSRFGQLFYLHSPRPLPNELRGPTSYLWPTPTFNSTWMVRLPRDAEPFWLPGLEGLVVFHSF